MRLRLLVGLAVGAVCVAGSSSAQGDPATPQAAVERIKALKAMPQKPDPAVVEALATFRDADAAAVAFVDLVRKYPDQRVEYCAYLLRGADGRIGFSPVRTGDMNHCPADRPRPANAVANVHTHPLWGRVAELSAAGQVFSEGDFGFAETDEMRMPIYLGAPAGHVLRYDPGGTSCKGESWMMRRFSIIRDLRPTVAGRLPVNPGEDQPLFDAAGKKIKKPDYCKPR